MDIAVHRLDLAGLERHQGHLGVCGHDGITGPDELDLLDSLGGQDRHPPSVQLVTHRRLLAALT